MDLPALFSLIAVSLLGLIPLFLALVRGRARRRERDTAAVVAERQRETATPGAMPPGANRGVMAPGVRAAARQRRAQSNDRDAGTAPHQPASGAEPRPIMDRVTIAQRAAARTRARAAASAMRRPGWGAEPASPPRRSQDAGQAIRTRLAGLSSLQRAIVYREILGPPVALRQPEER